MDVRMPELDGIEATRRICADRGGTGTRVLILTTFDLDEYVYEALRAGRQRVPAQGRPAGGAGEAVRVVAAGEALLAPAVTRRLIEEFARRPGAGPARAGRLDGLTERETEVLRLIARGLSNAEIAGTFLAATVKTHVGRILAKLGCATGRRRSFAYETGLVPRVSSPS